MRLKDGAVTIRPLAGTRPRGATPEADRALEVELLADPKERAEHLMLLDLGRNDVGRVSVPGTVEVTESFTVERYSQVMHIVSDVRGRADPKLDAVDTLLAALPAGTLSGAPKVRAMAIIDELESEKRGVGYGGGVGYISAGGEADICIVLRTAMFTADRIFVQAGAGVVVDSDPAAEYAETRAKARAPMNGATPAATAERSVGLNRNRRRIDRDAVVVEAHAGAQNHHTGHQHRRRRRQGAGNQGGPGTVRPHRCCQQPAGVGDGGISHGISRLCPPIASGKG